MKYLDLLAAYNLQKKPLLIKATIEKNITLLSPTMQEMYFLDPLFFNLKISREENLKIKEDIAKLINYKGKIISGDVKDGLLYVWAIIDQNLDQECFYYPGGLLESKKYSFKHKYEFYDNYYIDKIFIKKSLYSCLNMSYNTIEEKLTKVLSKHIKLFGKYFSALLTDAHKNYYFIFKYNNNISEEIIKILEKENISIKIELNPFSNTLLYVK